MPVELFEEVMEFEVGVVESLQPIAQSVPFVGLQPTGQTETRSFTAAILENEFLRVTTVPDLGGRVVSVVDKRTSTDWFENPYTLRPETGGPRGVRLPGGIRLEAGVHSVGDMGSWLTAVRETESSHSIVLMNPIDSSGLSMQFEIALAEDRAELILNVQTQNRTLDPVLYRPRLASGLANATCNGDRVIDASRSVGFFVTGAVARADGGEITLDRIPRAVWLAPRFVDSFCVRLTSIIGLSRIDLASPELAVQLDADRLTIVSPQRRLSCTLDLVDCDGEIFRAPASLYPEHPLVIEFPDAERRVQTIRVAGASHSAARSGPAAPFDVQIPSSPARPDTDLLMAVDPGWRTVAAIEEARRHVGARNWTEADGAYERALLFNGDDPLLWWEKGVAMRLSGVDHDGNELSNAHFLAPLEPRLRAESFLALGSELPKEPHAMVKPLAERPELLVDVTCAYVEAGFLEDAFRWADEALRHHDAPLLRFLMAWMLLRDTKMAVEAGTHLAAASRLGFRPPYPAHEIARKAIVELAARFPSDVSLEPWVKISSTR